MMKKSRIIAVDDDVSVTNALKESLEPQGYEVETINDSSKVIDSIKNNMPDLVLLDIRMPKPDGNEILKEIFKFNKKLNVIMISGSATGEDAMEALNEGAYNFISKPFDITHLRRLVAECINQSKYVG